MESFYISLLSSYLEGDFLGHGKPSDENLVDPRHPWIKEQVYISVKNKYTWLHYFSITRYANSQHCKEGLYSMFYFQIEVGDS